MRRIRLKRAAILPCCLAAMLVASLDSAAKDQDARPAEALPKFFEYQDRYKGKLDRFEGSRDLTRGIAIQPHSPPKPVDALPAASSTADDVRVWFHIRSDADKALSDKLYDAFGEEIAIDDFSYPLVHKPPQVVEIGPSQSQVRFFKFGDKEIATAIAEKLTALGEPATVADMTAQYGQADWLAEGHIEVWVAP